MTHSGTSIDDALARLAAAEPEAVRDGRDDVLQPMQTLIEGAQHFDEHAFERIRDGALAAMRAHAGDPAALAHAIGLGPDDASIGDVHARVEARLRARPLDDYRLDFEDGYGVRPDAEEDADADARARALARALRSDAAPARFGIRIKPLGVASARRALDTLDRFLRALLEAAGELPAGFVVTLPKVSTPEQAGVFATRLETIERELGLAKGALRFEFMVELPQIVLGPDGRSPLRATLGAGAGRALAAHFGTYDYTAACGIAPSDQTMHHPVCEHAKQMMRVAFAGTGLWLSDGSTNVLPVEPHVQAAWRRHFDDVTGSLRRGFYQGWDLHPAQLITRWTALHLFFRGGFDSAAQRLRVALDPAAAGAVTVLDDPATGQTLLGFVRRAVRSGAVDPTDAAARSGLTVGELSGGSWTELRAARTG